MCRCFLFLCFSHQRPIIAVSAYLIKAVVAIESASSPPAPLLIRQLAVAFVDVAQLVPLVPLPWPNVVAPVGLDNYVGDRRGAKARLKRVEIRALLSASIEPHAMVVYTKAERKTKIARFMEKRLLRKWDHAIQLKCRQVFATNRPRVNGRFVVLPSAICPFIARADALRPDTADAADLHDVRVSAMSEKHLTQSADAKSIRQSLPSASAVETAQKQLQMEMSPPLIKAYSTCTMCGKGPAVVHFRPCGEGPWCVDCSQVSACPLCGADVAARVRLLSLPVCEHV